MGMLSTAENVQPIYNNDGKTASKIGKYFKINLSNILCTSKNFLT